MLRFLTHWETAVVSAHRHKETLTWGIAAFYVVGTLQSVGAVAAKGTELPFRVLFASVYGVVSLLLITYARRQFNLRNYYVRMSAVLAILLSECIAGRLDHLRGSDVVPERDGVRADASGDPEKRAADSGQPHARGVLRQFRSAVVRTLRNVYVFFLPPYIPIDHFKSHYPAFVIRRARELPEGGGLSGLRRLYDIPYALMVVVGCAGMVAIFLHL